MESHNKPSDSKVLTYQAGALDVLISASWSPPRFGAFDDDEVSRKIDAHCKRGSRAQSSDFALRESALNDSTIFYFEPCVMIGNATEQNTL